MLDDFVKHFFREHNQEADHLANLETGGQRRVRTGGVKNAEAWKAERGCWDGSKKKLLPKRLVEM